MTPEERAQNYYDWYMQYGVPALAKNPSWSEDLRDDWISLKGTDSLAGFRTVFESAEKNNPAALRLMAFLVKHKVMYS